ncbi:hypothetical protein PC9H_010008 [Pleurotus ostreatus]|uniref:WD40 repeat-like protein n=1 Tax=Pleurotus ostreatus TaxID=5322 RepID=A0A8H6ZQ49_PLEOS|nr:uncharacterized protein PC9H_010008 [Pleurotus ostreatus]KAF7424697.1 hypothetical protein PC9H_010008 [Pleurotus ostreatus]KAJ8692312.1 hypothetical protein PTI98_009639 [Pleurotus ostreatus]
MLEASPWTPPEYNFSAPTIKASHTPYHDPSDFARQARWCADGSCILTNTESGRFQLLPSEKLHQAERASKLDIQTFPQASPIVEFAWFPSASMLNPATFCFAASVRDCPVKLLHGTDGRLRASYPIVDHRERFIAPHSLAFTPTMSSLYCGFEDAIEIFDLSMPGHPGTRLQTSPSKKSKDGIKGIVSALAFTPYSPEGSWFAAGSLSQSAYNICLYDQSQGDVPLLYLGAGSKSVRAGVMQLAFNNAKPHLLYASFRRHSQIYVWDLRGGVDEPICTLKPPEDMSPRTNQKLKFDLDASGKWLASGGPDGRISVWDLDETASQSDSGILNAAHTFQAHEDSIGSVAFHPLDSLLLSVSGSRHFDSTVDSDSGSDSEVSSDADGSVNPELRLTTRRVSARGSKTRPLSNDNSMKLWSLK